MSIIYKFLYVEFYRFSKKCYETISIVGCISVIHWMDGLDNGTISNQLKLEYPCNIQMFTSFTSSPRPNEYYHLSVIKHVWCCRYVNDTIDLGIGNWIEFVIIAK